VNRLRFVASLASLLLVALAVSATSQAVCEIPTSGKGFGEVANLTAAQPETSAKIEFRSPEGHSLVATATFSVQARFVADPGALDPAPLDLTLVAEKDGTSTTRSLKLAPNSEQATDQLEVKLDGSGDAQRYTLTARRPEGTRLGTVVFTWQTSVLGKERIIGCVAPDAGMSLVEVVVE